MKRCGGVMLLKRAQTFIVESAGGDDVSNFPDPGDRRAKTFRPRDWRVDPNSSAGQANNDELPSDPQSHRAVRHAVYEQIGVNRCEHIADLGLNRCRCLGRHPRASSARGHDFGLSVAEKPPLFDGCDNRRRHHLLPRSVVLLDAPKHVAGENMQDARVEADDTLDVVILE